MNNTQEATKEVQGYFGPKQMTRAEYVSRWKAPAIDLGSICQTQADYEQYNEVVKWAQDMAGRHWDNI